MELNGRDYYDHQWADLVIEASQGISDRIVPEFDEPTAALGPPDWDPVAATGSVSLGESGDTDCAARVVLAFEDNRLYNGVGPDLKVVEIGSTQERIAVSVRPGGTADWVDVGVLEAGESEIDLVGLDANVAYSQVRLCSLAGPVLGGSRSAESAGPDIDAVAAINSLHPDVAEPSSGG